MQDKLPNATLAGPVRDALDCLCLDFDSLHAASFDADTGMLVLELSIARTDGQPGSTPLQLHISPQASRGFVRLMQLMEEELAAVLEGLGDAPRLQ
jgi:hypothetical protein